MTTLLWFRQDLRLADNPALVDAADHGPVLPVYVLDEEAGGWALGGASRWWLHGSLAALAKALGGLHLARGDARAIIPALAKKAGANRIVWNRCYEPAAIARDTALKEALAKDGFAVKSFNSALLFEPWEIETQSGGPFKVFTPFWNALKKRTPAGPLAAPDAIDLALLEGSDSLEDWALRPAAPDWAKGWSTLWTPGEAGAGDRLAAFLDEGLCGYGEGRDRPDRTHVSRLSPHLHFGEMSPRRIWYAVHQASDRDPALAADGWKFLSELAWREFAAHLLYHFPTLPQENWRTAFDAYPWHDDATGLEAWQRGRTGYPFVDAGMRELWQTGYMHNRVRMVAASFLIKHLRVHWREGEAWFWDTLVDADLANNAAGWQWVAGSGADASPYFRIFNPVSQGGKFDPDGAYVRRWCPELADLPDEHVHAPFEAPASVLEAAGIILGKTYPAPIVEHRNARAAALEGYEAVKAAKE